MARGSSVLELQTCLLQALDQLKSHRRATRGGSHTPINLLRVNQAESTLNHPLGRGPITLSHKKEEGGENDQRFRGGEEANTEKRGKKEAHLDPRRRTQLTCQ